MKKFTQKESYTQEEKCSSTKTWSCHIHVNGPTSRTTCKVERGGAETGERVVNEGANSEDDEETRDSKDGAERPVKNGLIATTL